MIKYNNGIISSTHIVEQITSSYEGYSAYLVGNIITHLIQAPLQGQFTHDLTEAQADINRLIDHLAIDQLVKEVNIIREADNNERW